MPVQYLPFASCRLITLMASYSQHLPSQPSPGIFWSVLQCSLLTNPEISTSRQKQRFEVRSSMALRHAPGKQHPYPNLVP